MTHAVAIQAKTPDANGWYTFLPREEVRCPGQTTKPDGRIWVCNMYMFTVDEGEVRVRAAVRLHAGLERRQVCRIAKRCCTADGGCGTPLEIETRSSPQAAA